MSELETAWETARALDDCLSKIREAAEVGLKDNSEVMMASALRSILRLIGEPAGTRRDWKEGLSWTEISPREPTDHERALYYARFGRLE